MAGSMSVSRSQCIVFAILSSTLSSVATVLKVEGVRTVDPLLAASVGVLFGGLISWSYLILRRQVPSLAAIREVGRPLLMLIVCRPIIANTLFTIGLSMSSAITAVFLTKMEPYLVIFWVWVLDGKRPSSRHLLLLVIHILWGGVAVGWRSKIAMPGVMLWGDLLIVSAVVTAALSYRYAPQVTKKLSPLQTSTVAETIGGCITLPFALLLCPWAFGAEHIARVALYWSAFDFVLCAGDYFALCLFEWN
jgi:drug/metabolite transporter (DMT)-like permease